MPDISSAVPTDLPSTRSLVRSTALALAIAGVVLVTVILPAEYGVDPTGMGGVLGLTAMGEIKSSLSEERRLADQEAGAASRAAPSPPIAAVSPAPARSPAAPGSERPVGFRDDTTAILLQPNQGKEVKLSMREGARVTYSWSTDRGIVNYDQHADSKSPPRDYHGYRKGSGIASDQGELVAAFDGWHGWFWRNRGSEAVTVTLRTQGEFLDIKEMK